MVESREESVRLLEQISQQLDTLIRLTAASQIEGLNQTQTIVRLGSMGLNARMISEISGYPVTSVAPTLSKLRRSSRKPRAERAPSKPEEGK